MQREVYPDGTSQCRTCHQVKPLADFYRRKRRDGSYIPFLDCKPCNIALGVPKHQAWRKANPEKNRDQYLRTFHRTRAKKLGAVYEDIDFATIVERDGGLCHICTLSVLRKNRSFDHLIPLSRGGSHTADNIRLAHLSCNSRRNNRLPEEGTPEPKIKTRRLLTCPECQHQFPAPKRKKAENQS